MAAARLPAIFAKREARGKATSPARTIWEDTGWAALTEGGN